MAKSGVKTDNSDPDSGGKIETKYAGIDTPGLSHESSNTAFFASNNASVFHNQVIGQESPKINGEVTYADPPYTLKEKAKKLSDVREKFAKNADKPTTASADKGEKDLPSILQSVDPTQAAQILPNLYPQLMRMVSMLSIGSGNNQNNNELPSGIQFVLYDSFTGALCLLTKKYGFEKVIRVFVTAIKNDPNISVTYKNIVINSLTKLIQLALYFGPLNIPVSLYDETHFGDIVPSPLVETVPDLYIKKYYTLSDDPYPGYQKWISPDGLTILYTKKKEQSYHFSSASQEIFSESETELFYNLDPFVKDEILTTEILNKFLNIQITNIETNSLNNSVGNNSGSKQNLLSGLLGGQLQSLISSFSSNQLPNSVLNQGSINQVIQQYTKDMGLNNQIFTMGKSALGGLTNFSGMSGGGGGGAGSGFPTANFNNINYNNLSKQELSTVTDLINILGIKIS